MINKITLELNPNQVERLVEKLPMINKIRLTRRLEETTWQERMKRIVANIRRRAKRNPLPERDIARICEEVRQELYEERIKSSH